MGRACQWWIGDWINYGDAAYGEKYAQALDETGLDVQTLMNAAWVAGRIPAGLREERLSWTHHREVAALEPEPRQALLERAVAENLPTAKLAALVKAQKQNGTDPVGDLTGFKTEIHVQHDATDRDAADEWAQKLTARLASQGATVTYRSTRIA